jgi:hypothetical protein
MAEINVIAVIGKLRPKARQRRTVGLADLADEIARHLTATLLWLIIEPLLHPGNYLAVDRGQEGILERS